MYNKLSAKYSQMLDRALQHHQQGQLAEARDLYQKLLKVSPLNTLILTNLGSIALQTGDIAFGIRLIEKSVSLDPNQSFAFNNLGNAFAQHKRFEEAIACFQKSLAIEPNNAQAYANLGNALKSIKEYDKAILNFNLSLSIDPLNAVTYFNRGAVFKKLNQSQNALLSYDLAIAINPDYAEAYCSRGDVYLSLDRYEDSFNDFQRALNLNPYFVEVYINLGILCFFTGSIEDACQNYEMAINLDPDCAKAIWNKSQALMAIGNLSQAWPCYEKRWEWDDFPSEKRCLPFPQWHPEFPVTDKVLIYREQGIGDEIMFVSMLPDFLSVCPQVVLECSGRLVDLFRRSFPNIQVRAVEPSLLDSVRDDDIKSCLALGSLPLFFRPSVEDFYQNQPKQYLLADQTEASLWCEWLNSLPAGIKVGLCWRSSWINKDRNKYYTELNDWIWLIEDPRFTVINLQYDDAREEIASVNSNRSGGVFEPPAIDQMQELDRAAALISQLDIVITADTAVCTLASGLGIKTLTYGPYRNPYVFNTARLSYSHHPWSPCLFYFPYHSHQDSAHVVCPRIKDYLEETYFGDNCTNSINAVN